MNSYDPARIARAWRRRAGRVGVLKAQADTRDEVAIAAIAYASLRQGIGTYTDTLSVELRDGTVVTANVTLDLVPLNLVPLTVDDPVPYTLTEEHP